MKTRAAKTGRQLEEAGWPTRGTREEQLKSAIQVSDSEEWVAYWEEDLRRPRTRLWFFHWIEEGGCFRPGLNFANPSPDEDWLLPHWLLMWRWGKWEYFLDLSYHGTWGMKKQRFWWLDRTEYWRWNQ